MKYQFPAVAAVLFACLGAAPSEPDSAGTKARGLLHETPANVAELVLNHMGCEEPFTNSPGTFACQWKSGPGMRINAMGSEYTHVLFYWEPLPDGNGPTPVAERRRRS